MSVPVYKRWTLLICLQWGEQVKSFVLPQPEPWEHPRKMAVVSCGRCDAAVFSMAWHVTYALGIRRVFRWSVEISWPGYTIVLVWHKSMLVLKGVEVNGSDENPTFLPWKGLALSHHPAIICHMATQTLLPTHADGHMPKQWRAVSNDLDWHKVTV